jgi:Viral BACON domain/Putative binding domain, N-terminal
MSTLLVRRTALVTLTAVLFLGASRIATAQVVIDPDVVEFNPSPDHLALNKQGAAVVDQYELWFYLPGAAKPFQVVGLDKPDPGTDGKIRVWFRPLLTTIPPEGVLYEARIAANGPGGRSVSAPSNTFSFGGSCAYEASPAGATFPAGGGTATLTIAAPPGCSWTGASSASWLSVSGKGTGSGTVTISAVPNTAPTARSASIAVGTATITVSQAGISCGYVLSPTTMTLPFGGGSGSVAMKTSAACSWIAVSSAPWLNVVGPTSGSGNGTIQIAAAVNTTVKPRTATISAGGTSVTVVQAGMACEYTLAASSAVMAATAGTGSVGLTSPAGCTWTAASNAAWLSVVAWAGGNGNGIITFEAEANTSGASREAIISAAGQAFRVTQQAAGNCLYSLSPGSQVLPVEGGSGSLTVTTGKGCAWSAASDVDWVELTGASNGMGSATVTFSVARNTTAGGYRNAHVSVAGRQFYVWQNPAPCTYSFTPSIASLPSSPASGTVQLSAPTGCSWAVSSTAAWLAISSSTFGDGTAEVVFTAAANLSSAPRTAVVQGGKTSLTVTQAGVSGCSVDLPADRVTLGREAQTTTTTVVVTGDCVLTANSTVGWLAVKSVDTVKSSVTFTVSKNDTGLDRAAALQVGTNTLLVVQKSVGIPKAPQGVRVTGMSGGR